MDAAASQPWASGKTGTPGRNYLSKGKAEKAPRTVTKAKERERKGETESGIETEPSSVQVELCV